MDAMSEKKTVFLCEPQCVGFEHVPVNAALLEVFHHTFPDRELIFAAEAEHGKQVVALCKQGTVTFTCLAIIPPDRDLNHIHRYFPEKRLFRQIIDLARQQGCKTVVFTSLTDTCFFLQKKFAARNNDLHFINFLHGMLQSVREKAPWKPWKKIFWFPHLLGQPMDDNIHFFVYGDSIRRAALARLPGLTDHLSSLDHPCFFHSPQPESNSLPLRIGAIGIGGRSKGTHLFFQLAERCRQQIREGELEFIVIGPIFDKKISEIPDYVQCHSPHTPLQRSEYEQLISSIDYGMFLYDRGAYQMTASGAFMDAMAFARPVIALENPFFAYYFKQFGNIGHLCNDVDKIGDLLQNLLQLKQEQYHDQVQNIIEGRKRISLPELGRGLEKTITARFPGFREKMKRSQKKS
jgi:hypothetical protein